MCACVCMHHNMRAFRLRACMRKQVGCAGVVARSALALVLSMVRGALFLGSVAPTPRARRDVCADVGAGVGAAAAAVVAVAPLTYTGQMHISCYINNYWRHTDMPTISAQHICVRSLRSARVARVRACFLVGAFYRCC